jgi:SAM-dependent methyltransferase
VALLDLGCGNGQLLKYFRQRALACRYVGVDFSTSLLDAAREQFASDLEAEFLHDDVEKLGAVVGKFDYVIYSHVIEMLASPEASLIRACTLAPRIIIRFFEPPEFDVDTVEIRQMEVGEGRSVPYLRRKMSRDYYQLILSHCGCKKVEVYQADGDKDQIHVLSF